MIRCALCGSDLGDHDGYVRGSISGEVYELSVSPKATGQAFQHNGIAFCIKHFEDIPKNISENLGLTAKQRKLSKS
jgi:hypothetical protein